MADVRGTTNFSKLAIAGTVAFSGSVTATATSKTTSLTALSVTRTATVSGTVQATAANKTHKLTRIYSVGTLQASGKVIATATGKQTALNALAVTATSQFSGNIQITSAANAASGLLVIPAGGTATQACTKALASSRILLQPIVVPGATIKGIAAWVSTIANATGFTVQMDRSQTTGTRAACAGRVAWFVINKA